MVVFRFFHSSTFYQNTNKGALSVLRKKTGYGLSHCRKALEIHNNDVAKAEDWLLEQAKILGWNAAIKVQNRAAFQGLIGVAVNRKKVAMVEVNCETDFVSKNEKFKSVVKLVASTCLGVPLLSSEVDTNKVNLNEEDIGKLKANNTCLSDHVAMLISSTGENVKLKRAFCYETRRADVDVAVAVHPASTDSGVLLGKYGSFLSFQCPPEMGNKSELKTICNGLCQHIIGMNPIKVGDFKKDEPNENVDEENVLVHQELLMDPTVTVGHFLNESGITVLDFMRFECGETQKRSASLGESEEEEVNVAKN